jgi:hypothetical protein
MPVVGQITASGSSISFLCARSEAGSPLETPMESAEEMTSPGVDGRRWRTIHKLHPAFVLQTVTEANDYYAGIKIRNSAEKLVNKLVTLYLTINGSNFYFSDVHVDAVRAVVVSGPVVAVGSTGGLAHLMIEWSLTMTDFDQATQA